MICTIYPEESEFLKLALKNAYYMASMDASIKEEIPLAPYLSQSFSTVIWEEDKFVERNIVFNKNALGSKQLDEDQIIELYKYENIAQDQVFNLKFN